MFRKILIANRGEIACRIMRTAREMSVATVAVYSDADANAQHVAMADEAVPIGRAHPRSSYLNAQAIIDAAKLTNAEAIHPGYGFLSENPDFADATEAAGLKFIGPSADAIRKMGLKDAAKTLMAHAGVPVVPGYHRGDQDPARLANEAAQIGFPVIIKARAGGGGKGMRVVVSAGEFASALESAKRVAGSSVGDEHVLIEKYISSPRHIEVQIFGDHHGNYVHLFERDCSVQRRHQKVIEESPAPGMTKELRQAMTDAALRAARAIDYDNAGTVEFIVDGAEPLSADAFWFMEMNTRLQVEHPVTEEVTGNDLVAWQLQVAAGLPLPKKQGEIELQGHAIEARVYAEDVTSGFLPAPGQIKHLEFGKGRIETGIRTGDTITPWYDPMIAKVITVAKTRDGALAKLRDSLCGTHIAGTTTNIAFLSAAMNHDEFATGQVDTGFVERNLAALTANSAPSERAICFAAISAAGVDVNQPFIGWRLWSEGVVPIKLMLNGEVVVRRLTIHGRKEFSISGGEKSRSLSDIVVRSTELSATYEGRPVRAKIATFQGPDGEDYISLRARDGLWEFKVPNPLFQDKSDEQDLGTVLSPMTGVVCDLLVREGEKVLKGDKIVVVEAMKMEHVVTAACEATVSKIFCQIGQAVRSNDVLLQYDVDRVGDKVGLKS